MMCATCDAADPVETSEWFNHIWFLHQLKQGGYPFDKNDLALDEWMGLAEMDAAMQSPPLPETGR